MNNVIKNSKTSPKKSVTAKQLAKSNLTKRKNPDWDNLDRGYRYLTLDMKLPHDLAVAVMGNVVEESLGDYKSVLKNGGGRGLIQWDGRKAPNGRYSLWGSIWASVAKPANVYDSTTDTVKNYWAPWGGLKGDKVRLKFIKAPLKEKAKIYAESYLRPGKPRIADRQLSTMQLDSIYNPRIKDIIVLKDGGILEFLKNGSGIHIKEKNRGKFTKSAKAAGLSVQEHAKSVLNDPNATPLLKKRANFARNAAKWHHKHDQGGTIVNESPIVTNHINWIQSMSDYLQKKDELDLKKKQLELLEKQLQSDMFSNIGGIALNYLPDIISSFGGKKSNNSTTLNKVGTINSNGSMNTGIGGLTYNWNTNTFGSNNIMNGFNKISLT